MQKDVELETLPFESSAPTFGFYTYGEFYGIGRLTLLNATMVAVGLREGSAAAPMAVNDAADAAAETADPDPFDNKHVRIVARLTHFIQSVTSDLEAANRQITRMSITDWLTQLPNRARLDQALEENIALATRYGNPFSVILLDVDHFKRINDLHGHLVGDKVLSGLGQVLASQTRSTDIAGRWGGEEFLIVAPQTSLPEAATLAEKLRSIVAGTDFPGAGRATISLGVAAYSPGGGLNELLAGADAALYLAKGEGRNRVELSLGSTRTVGSAGTLHDVDRLAS
jgi:diguanylate cyclase (GGDEF)-like protein